VFHFLILLLSERSTAMATAVEVRPASMLPFDLFF